MILKACKFNFVVSGPEKILTETENLPQGAEAQYSLSQSFFGSGDREVEFTYGPFLVEVYFCVLQHNLVQKGHMIRQYINMDSIDFGGDKIVTYPSESLINETIFYIQRGSYNATALTDVGSRLRDNASIVPL